MPAEFHIRPARARDAAAIAVMANDLARFNGSGNAAMDENDVLADLIGADNGLDVLVAESGGAAVAYALHQIAYETAEAARGRYLSDLFVAAGARRRGIAKALIAEVAALTRAEGGTFLWWVEKRNAGPAKALYAPLASVSHPVTAHAVTHLDFNRLAEAAETG